MRRLFTAAALCAAFLALTGAASASPALRAPSHGLAPHGPAAARTAVSGVPAPAHHAPLGKRLGQITLNVHVTNYDGSAGAGVDVMWRVDDGTTTYSGSGTADAFGDVTFTEAVAAGGNGELYTWIGDSAIQGWGDLTWIDGATVTLQPARVQAGAVRGGPWADETIPGFNLALMGDNRYSGGWVPATAATPSDPLVGTLDTADGEYDRGALYFFSNEGVEFTWASPITLVSGVLTDIGDLDESAAQRMAIASPYWASGAPGSTIRLAIGQFPAGWDNRFSGRSEYPSSAPVKAYGTETASGAETEFYTFRVPATATPGYWFNISAQHTNGLEALDLMVPFQVCTMKPSKTSVRFGARINVKGVVPIYRHWGTDPGTPKSVTLYAHRGKAAVPTKWDPRSQGWSKVCTVKTNRFGAYKTPYIVPLRTLTLVVRYPGDSWWYDAYTSARTVKVR